MAPERTAPGIVCADHVYTKWRLAEILGVSERTVDRVLAELDIRPFRSSSACPLISGAVFAAAVRKAQSNGRS